MAIYANDGFINNSKGLIQSKSGWSIEDRLLPYGEQTFTSVGTTTWTVPDGVYEISAVCVGGGGGAGGGDGNYEGAGGGGGGVSYGSTSVTPGNTLYIRVGAGGTGGRSYNYDNVFSAGGPGNSGESSYIKTESHSGTSLFEGGGGGGGEYGIFTNAVGGSGGTSSGTMRINGGSGGAGGNGTSTRGGGGGGNSALTGEVVNPGGGVGLYGTGSNGFGGVGGSSNLTTITGGSGGTYGTSSSGNSNRSVGGLYGGGGGSRTSTSIYSNVRDGGNGGQGAVRIVWGTLKSYPTTAVSDGNPNPILLTEPSYYKTITHPSAADIDSFGWSVAVGSGRIVAGALGDTVNGISNTGSALIYGLSGNYVGIITHPNASDGDGFGNSVAVGSGRIVVGAYSDTVNGLAAAGSAHIYDLSGNYVGIITHPNGAANDYFGDSVAVGSERIVVGAPFDDIDIGLTHAGSALIYDLSGNYVGIITHPNASTFNYFGSSVAVGCGRIVVGAYNDTVNGISGAGSALIYDLNGSHVGIITHPSAAASDYFGSSVAVGSGRIVVGAYNDTVNGIAGAGSAHIYDLSGNYVGIMTHPNAAANDNFGKSVAVGSGRIVVGAPFDDVNGILNAGSAHVYDLNRNYVGILTYLSASADDYFGDSVAVGSGRIVVGAYGDDVNELITAGSAHIYNLSDTIDTYYEQIIDNYKY